MIGNEHVDLSRKIKILIADDDESSRMYLTRVIRGIDNSPIIAKTGMEVVDAFQEHSDVDLILMDIKMPELNGYDVTKKLRLINKDVIIIAQTAFNQPEDRQKAIESGCNDQIGKPINPGDLIMLIKQYLKLG